MLDGRQHDPPHRPRADDGGGPAVHLRRDLQDGEPARGGHGRGGRAAPHRRVEARREGHRHLPRQLQGRPAAVDGQEGRRRRRPSTTEVGREGRRAHRREGHQRARPARSCPRQRTSQTFDFRVADCKGFVTVGEFDDGRPGEIFLRVSKQGSTLAGIMDAFAISVSYGLQYGVPLRVYVETFTNTRFEPAGMTDDPTCASPRRSSTTSSAAWRSTTCRSRSGPSSTSSPRASARSPRSRASRRPSPRPARAATSRPTRPASTPRRPAGRHVRCAQGGEQRGARPQPSQSRPKVDATRTPRTACSAASRCSEPAPATPAPAAAAPAAAASAP